jgi:hypothetical protein
MDYTMIDVGEGIRDGGDSGAAVDGEGGHRGAQVGV